MVLAVPPEHLDAFLALCRAEDVEATHLGMFTDDRRLRVLYDGETLVDLDMAFVHDGRPQRVMEAVWTKDEGRTTRDEPDDPLVLGSWSLVDTLKALLAHPNIASKERIVRTYDHLVQGRTLQGPLGGVHGDGPTNAAVLQPRHTTKQAIALGCGINPRYGSIDPYWMALAACDEALRNIVAVGADPYRTALLDNFCWGDPREPDRLAGLVRAAAGCRDVAQVWSTPFISGKDSLNNEYRDASGQRVPIPPTLLVTALGVVPSIDTTITSELQQSGNLIYLVGLTKNELGGSHYLLLRDELGQSVPQVDLIQARRTFRTLHLAITLGYVQSCHDLSEGGLGVAAAEMVLGSALGLDLDLATVAADDNAVADATLLFSESPSRFLVEVRPEDSAAFGALMDGIDVGLIGFVTDDERLRVDGLGGDEVLAVDAAALRDAWQTPLVSSAA
jgi:phosphoribosylformylglycinamidine synthase